MQGSGQLCEVGSHVGCDVERSPGASSPICKQWCHESPELVTRNRAKF